MRFFAITSYIMEKKYYFCKITTIIYFNMLSTLYSIGHGHKTAEELINELHSFSIQFLIDVRSNPFSKWAPHFNRGMIEQLFKNTDIRYFYMGDCIGGRPLNDDCYDENGCFDYQKMAKVPDFKKGLQRLIDANSGGYKVAIMCSESDPSLCHRSKLIGRELLAEHNIVMYHIIAPRKIKSEEDIITELTNGAWDPHSLFFDNDKIPYFKSRKAYKAEPEFAEEYD